MTDLSTREPLAADWLDQANALCATAAYPQALGIVRAALASDLSADARAQALNLAALCLLGLNQLAEAETHWRACIAAQPALVDAYDNLGALLVALGRFDDAETVYRLWLAHRPHDVDALCRLAAVLRERKQWPQANALYRQALVLRPDDAEIEYGLALTLHDQRSLAEAERAYRAVLERRPDHPGVPYRLANVLKDLGRFAEAIGAYQRALAIEPHHADALHHLGDALRCTGHLSEAEQACTLSLAIRPDDARTLNTLAAVLCALQRLDEAEAACRRALALEPALAEAHFNLGIVLAALGRLDEAAHAYERARDHRPGIVEIHNNLGCVLRDLERLDEAAEVFRDALAIKADFAQAAYNLGNVYKALGQFDASEAAYRHAIAVRSTYPEAAFGLATLLLGLGRFDEAWPLYESRYAHPEFVHHASVGLIQCRQWQGEPVKGASLLLWQEDGLGDMIQFGRYIGLLKAAGAVRVVFACMPALRALFADVAGIDAVIDHQSALAQAAEFDYWASPLSLPLHLHTTHDARAPAHYLRAAPARIDAWRARLARGSAGLAIGLVWKGNPRHHNDAHRSLPSLATLAPLWSVRGAHFVSLQKGRGEDEAQAAALASPPRAIEPLGAELADLADTAAVIAQLDLVICVDTSVAHLAASLGKPCWILLPARDVDWRWMHERDDSPWYPDTVRLFRQGARESWDDVVERVRAACVLAFET